MLTSDRTRRIARDGLIGIAGLRASAGMVLRFALVGFVKAALDFGSFNLILLVSPADSRAIVILANTVGFSVAVGASFLLNARYTFRAPVQRQRFWRYVAISLVGLALYDSALALLLAVSGMDGIVALNAAKAAALVASTAWNFVGYRYLVFRPALATPAR